VITDLRLPPKLSITLRILPPTHPRGGGPPWRMTQIFGGIIIIITLVFSLHVYVM